jgi:hypothetical protein
LENPTATLPESTVSISRRICYQDSELIDELCRRAEALEAVSGEVRLAIERNRLDALHALRDEFNALRDEIIAGVCRLTRHRLQYHK